MPVTRLTSKLNLIVHLTVILLNFEKYQNAAWVAHMPSGNASVPCLSQLWVQDLVQTILP